MNRFLGFKIEEILTCLLLIVVGYFVAKMFSERCDCNGFSVGNPWKCQRNLAQPEKCDLSDCGTTVAGHCDQSKCKGYELTSATNLKTPEIFRPYYECVEDSYGTILTEGHCNDLVTSTTQSNYIDKMITDIGSPITELADCVNPNPSNYITCQEIDNSDFKECNQVSYRGPDFKPCDNGDCTEAREQCRETCTAPAPGPPPSSPELVITSELVSEPEELCNTLGHDAILACCGTENCDQDGMVDYCTSDCNNVFPGFYRGCSHQWADTASVPAEMMEKLERINEKCETQLPLCEKATFCSGDGFGGYCDEGTPTPTGNMVYKCPWGPRNAPYDCYAPRCN